MDEVHSFQIANDLYDGETDILIITKDGKEYTLKSPEVALEIHKSSQPAYELFRFMELTAWDFTPPIDKEL